MLKILTSIALLVILTSATEAAGKRRLAQAPRLPQGPPVRAVGNCGDPSCPCGCATGAPCTCVKTVKTFTNTSLVCENGSCSTPVTVGTPVLGAPIVDTMTYGSPNIVSNPPTVTYSTPSYSYASTPVYYAPSVSYGVYGGFNGGYRSYGSYGGGFSGGGSCSGGG
jgi:hypothetical protein